MSLLRKTPVEYLACLLTYRLQRGPFLAQPHLQGV